MIVRRIDRDAENNATISVRIQWGLTDVEKVMKRVGSDLRAVGLPLINECDLRTIVGGWLFQGLKAYQSAPLIDWAISVARRNGMIADSPAAGKVIIML